MQFIRPIFLLLFSLACLQAAAPPPAAELPGDRVLAEYFQRETTRINQATFAGIKTRKDWEGQRATAREQALEMMGLSPLPERTDLKATITGRVEHEEFYVEKLHYQSMPGLYVGASLYVPKNLKGKVPAILYVCGHATVKEGGIALGAKANYQHHGGWFARHGYVCLTLDTIQYGELEGLHHGVYWHRMWWWYARGYTPAGVEVWNSIRALDYLQSRPEVDGEKLGMTGRSGGGGYTWFTAAVDERVKAAVPVAGMTDLQNQVVDGCVRGHCDCMFTVNTYRWDFAKLASLVAPRPLLISNSDKDWIFPLDGVYRLHQEVARIYKLYKAEDKLGLLITEGPHKDTQDLQVPAFRWFDRFLKGQNPLISVPATKLLPPASLRVFDTLPADQRTTTIHETFVPRAKPAVPADRAEWTRLSDAWSQALREKSFRGWPDAAPTQLPARLGQERKGNLTMTTWEFASQEGINLPLYVLARGEGRTAKILRLHVLDEAGWSHFVGALGGSWKLPPVPPVVASPPPGTKSDGTKQPNAPAPRPPVKVTPTDFAALQREVEQGDTVLVFFAPRGVGPTAWGGNEVAKAHILRRFMLLGQTLEGMRVWDIRRAVESLRQPALFGPREVQVSGERNQAVNALYASLFAEGVGPVEMIDPPGSHEFGPDYLNVLRFLDVPQAAAMAADKRPVRFVRGNREEFGWTLQASRVLGWPANRLQW